MKKLNLIIMFLVVLLVTLPLNANTCLDFDGLNDHVLVPSNSELRPTNNFTIEAWIKPNDIITQKVIIMHDENGGANDGYSLTLTNSVINFGAHNGSPQYIISDEMLVANSWNYIAAVYDNSTLKLYVNGVSKTLVGSGSVVYSLTGSVNIGRRGGTNLPNTLFYDGEMDELRFWNVARTEAEINDNMHYALTGSETGLIAYWQFNEGTGTNLGDSAGSNDGTLTNMGEEDWVESPLLRPVAQSLLPTDNSTDILQNSDLEITFDRNVTAGSGNIIIYKTADDSIVETISASSCGIAGSTVTINPSNLEFNTGYYVLIEGNAFHDGYGDYYYGISDKTVWNFVTEEFNYTALTPLDNSVGVLLDSNLKITFDRNVIAGSGNIIIHKSSDDSIVETISAATFVVNDSIVTIDPSNDLELQTNYYVLIDSTAFMRSDSLYFDGITDKTGWNFKTVNLFTDINAGLLGVDYSSVAWGDYDNDGDLDALLTGYSSSGRISRIYRNDSGVFTDINAGLPGVDYGSVAWGDYDNDGDLDVLLTGYYFDGSSHYISRIYRNDSGVFTDIGAGLVGVSYGSVAWGDYDNDGDLDILLTGRSESSINISKIYRNDSGIFVDIGAGLIGVQNSSVAWGDYDNDGDLDVFLTGVYYDGLSWKAILRIYRNDSGVFTDIGAGLTDVYNSSVAWGDYDNDGDLDILLAGQTTSSLISRIYRNDSGVFTDIGAGSEYATSMQFMLVSLLDLVLSSKEVMVDTDYLYWEYIYPDYIDSYLIQIDDDINFDDPIEEEISLSKKVHTYQKNDIKISYIGIALNSLTEFDSLENNTVYYWRMKPVYFGNKPTRFTRTPSSFLYDKTYFAPSPINIVIDGSSVTLSWNTAKDAIKGEVYNVYSTNDPYAVFPVGWDYEATVSTTEWVTTASELKKFYCVTATSGKEEVENADLRSVQTKR